MAATIKDEFGVEPSLIRGRDGIFDVIVDGEKVFSKHDTGRFPEEEEVIASIREKQA